jgi:hypothetical protein
MDIENGQSDRQSNGLALWSRLRSLLLSRGVESQGGCTPLAVVTAPSLVPVASSAAGDQGSVTARPEDQSAPLRGGVVLPFPIHGEALLVKLADVLRARIADRCSESDPLLLVMSRHPRSRLSIDRRAYIEFYQNRSEYRAVIEVSHETKVILETADFDALVDFVLQYLVGRLAKPAALEAMS